jgi:hypothetical protein
MTPSAVSAPISSRMSPGQQGRERREGFLELDLRLVALAGPVEQLRQGADVVRAVHDVDPGGAVGDLLPLHLGQAAADGDLHARVRLLGGEQVTEVAVQPVGRVLTDRAGVEYDKVRRAARAGLHVAGVLEQARYALGVMHVHLAPVGADLVRPSFSHVTRIGVHAHQQGVSWYWMGP